MDAEPGTAANIRGKLKAIAQRPASPPLRATCEAIAYHGAPRIPTSDGRGCLQCHGRKIAFDQSKVGGNKHISREIPDVLAPGVLPAVRRCTPLLIGFVGASSSGARRQ